jgi:superfamily II DNA or RNA helicase
MASRKPYYIKTAELKGTGREAQNMAQDEARKEFMDPNGQPKPYRIMFNMATGTGKGKLTVECLIDYYNNKSKKPAFIGCFTEKQRDKLWPTQLAEWGRMHHVVNNYQSACYASFRNIKGLDLGVVVLDEAHRMSEGDEVFFENNKFEAVIVLTATEPANVAKRRMLRRLTYGRRIIIANKQAIDAKMLNDYQVNVMYIEPDQTKHFKLDGFSNTLYNEWTGYARLSYLYDQARKSGNGPRIRFAYLNRLRFMGNCESKTRACIYIQNKIREKGHRFVVCAASIDQTAKLSEYVCHSKSTKKHYDDFCAGRISELISVDQLKEGENFENLGRMIYVQPNGKPNDFEQLKGRAQRLPVGQLSIIYMIVLKGTGDETYARKSLENTPPEKIKSFTLDREDYWPIKDHLEL